MAAGIPRDLEMSSTAPSITAAPQPAKRLGGGLCRFGQSPPDLAGVAHHAGWFLCRLGAGGWNYLLMAFTRCSGRRWWRAGAAALNQLLEREYDARMRRTANRPLPSGRLQPVTVMLFGGVCALVGMAYLALLVNPLTSVLGAISLGQLSVHLHPAEAHDVAEHGGGRDSRARCRR